MPRQRCQIDETPGWKWGEQGKCYTYGPGTDRSEGDAIRLAEKQGAAIGHESNIMGFFEFLKSHSKEVREFADGAALEIFDLDGLEPGHDFPKTEEDLEVLAAGYDPSFFEAAINYDHKHEGPSHGWIETVWREGKKLFAKVRGISEQLQEDVRSGKYKRLSAEMLTPGHKAFNENDPRAGNPYLAGLAVLGAKNPAVKGMTPIPEFAAQIEKELVNCDTKGRVDVISFESERGETEKGETIMAQIAKIANEDGVTVEQFAEQKQQISDLTTKNEKLKEQVAEFAEREKEAQRKQRTAKFEGWLDGELKTKYVQAKRADILATFEALPDEEHEKRLFEALKETPNKVELGEKKADPPEAPETGDTDFEEVERKVKEYQQKHNIATFGEAYEKCMARV